MKSILILSALVFCGKESIQPAKSCVDGYCQVYKYSEIKGNWILFKIKGTITSMRATPFDSVWNITDVKSSLLFIVSSDSANSYYHNGDTCYQMVTDQITKDQILPDSNQSFYLNNDTLKIYTKGNAMTIWENPSWYYMPNTYVKDIMVCNN